METWRQGSLPSQTLPVRFQTQVRPGPGWTSTVRPAVKDQSQSADSQIAPDSSGESLASVTGDEKALQTLPVT